MKYATLLTGLFCFLLSCQQKAPDYPEQLRSILSTRVAGQDTAVKLDSFRMIRLEPITVRLGLQISDSIYKISYYKVVNQLSAAKAAGKTDSIRFFQEELDYMQGNVDSFAKRIASSDTSAITFGNFAMCSYLLKHDMKTHDDTAYFFFDKHMNLMNRESLDSSLNRAINSVR